MKNQQARFLCDCRMLNIPKQKDMSNIFQLSNPVVFAPTRLRAPENFIIKLIQAIKETKRVFKYLSYRICDFSGVYRPDLKCAE